MEFFLPQFSEILLINVNELTIRVESIRRFRESESLELPLLEEFTRVGVGVTPFPLSQLLNTMHPILKSRGRQWAQKVKLKAEMVPIRLAQDWSVGVISQISLLKLECRGTSGLHLLSLIALISLYI